MNQQLLTSLLEAEEIYVLRSAMARMSIPEERLGRLTEEEAASINLALNEDDHSLLIDLHGEYIRSLISLYVEHTFPSSYEELSPLFNLSAEIEHIELKQEEISEIPSIIEEVHCRFLNSLFEFTGSRIVRKKSKHFTREGGSVYTLRTITHHIISECIKEIHKTKYDLRQVTLLDFASGTGRFYFEALDILHSDYRVSYEDIVCNCLHAVDIDETAILILRLKVLARVNYISPSLLQALEKNIISRNALIPKTGLFTYDERSIDLERDFSPIIESGGFDIVCSNPPYLVLKVNKRDSSLLANGYYDRLQERLNNQINFFRTAEFYKHSIEGMLNYYKLSIEMILTLTKPKGRIGIICPASLFADLSSTKLRKHILDHHGLTSIQYFPESARLFENVSQATTIFFIQKGESSKDISIQLGGSSFVINHDIIRKVFSKNYEIPFINEVGWRILRKLSKHKRLKDIEFLRNKRGELDLTLLRPLITKENTGWRLVRGNMISLNEILDKNEEYVDIEAFLKRKSEDYKQFDFNKERLICQQISNIDLKRRLNFVFCDTKDILGNSCNYIVSTRGKEDLERLKLILNSELINWRFKITSSNNHINNYELDELPIANLEFDVGNLSGGDEVDSNIAICKLYGLDDEEIDYVLKNVIQKQYV